jgi:hypothetical protein
MVDAVSRNFADFRTGLASRKEALRHLGALVDPVRLLETIIAEFDDISRFEAETLLSLTQAAYESGYSADALGRMVRAGKIPNRGRSGAPKVRRADLPRKAGRCLTLSDQSVTPRTHITRTLANTPH